MKPARQVAVVWVFASSSNPDKFYQTLLYMDQSTSCDCPAWTKRCVGGQRTCKHVRAVDTGIADATCTRRHCYKEAWGALGGYEPADNTPGPKLIPINLPRNTGRRITLED